MNNNDSYPPADISDSSVNDETMQNEAENEVTPEPEKTKDGWDGSEAEIVVDDESEEYEEETTGIKLTYKLTADEIKNFIKRSEVYAKNKKIQQKHTLVQSLVFVALVVLSVLAKRPECLWFALCPLVALAIILLLPVFGIKRFIKDVYNNDEISVEIFPDKIDVSGKNFSKEIVLDGSCECKEHDDLITVSSKDGVDLIIPVRAVEPEFLAEVQAMILAGTKTES